MSILYVTMQKIKLFIIKLPFFESLNFSNFGIILSDYLPNLKLDKDSIIIDCGANIGDFTSVVARSGSRVVSVEPHGECFSILRKRFATNKNITLKRGALSDHTGKTRLYLHKILDGVSGSQASSLEIKKDNLDPSKYEEVETFKLSDIVFSLNKQVDLIKIDIEGHEDVVLNDLIDTGAIDRVRYVLVERHDQKYDFLKERLRKVEEKILKNKLNDKINLNWR